MFADHLLEDVPHLRSLALHQALRRLDGRGFAAQLQLGENEGLEQFQSHFLRQSALMQAQGRTHDDDRTARVVDALAQQVLAEAALLALDHVGQGLERALVGARDGPAAAAVVQEGIYRFLQHALFVAHDDVRRVQFQQAAQTVVAIDDAPVQVVQVGGREAAAVERHQGTKIRRQHRQHREHHPLRLVAGLHEGFDELQALRQALDLGLGVGVRHVLADFDHFGGKIHGLEQLVDRFGAHAGIELIAVLFDRLEIHFVREQLAALQRGHAGIDHHEGFEVQHALDLAQGHVQHETDAGGQGLQEPDVRSGAGQLDMSHALAAHLGLRHFHAALLADHAAMLQALVLAAQTLVVLHGPEDLGAEQAVAFRLEGPVVDGFRLLHFAVRPGADHVRRREPDLDRIEILDRYLLLEQLE